MKIHYKSYRLLPLMLLAALCWSCQKDEHTNNFRITMDGWDGANGQKVYLDGLSPKFEVGDKVRINAATYIVEELSSDNKDGKTWWALEYLSGAESDWAPFKAGFPASALKSVSDLNTATGNITVNVPQRQYYRTVTVNGTEKQKLNAPMFANSGDNYIAFHNACSVIDIAITNDTNDVRYIDSIDVIADNAQLSGEMSVSVESILAGEPAVVGGTATPNNNWVRLYGIGGAGGQRLDVDATAHYYIYLPTYTNAKLTVRVYENSHGYKYKCEKVQFENYSGTGSAPTSANLPRNKIFTVSFSLSGETKDGFTPVTGGGGFTVKMEGGKSAQKVYLGYGNLFHDASTTTLYEEWFIAPFQYDLCGCSPEYDSRWTDLFYVSQGTSNNYGLSSLNKYSFANFVDWSTKVDPSPAKGWRTLSGEEWDCLMNGRTNATNLHGYATITGIDVTGTDRLDPFHTNTSQVGCIILPDDWVMPSAVGHFTGGQASFTSNTYTYDEWLLMEEAGAIFIPWKALNGGNKVSYWISSYNNNTTDIYNYCFHQSDWGGGVHNHGTDPCFVRLAINVEKVDVYPPKDE